METKLVVIVEFSDNNLSAYVRDIDKVANSIHEFTKELSESQFA